MRASDLLGAAAYDDSGQRLGWIVELVAETTPDGPPAIKAVLIAPRRHLRLLGYDRHGMRHPVPIRQLANRLRRNIHEVTWNELRLAPPPT
ncbi:PRC-barrel domain-containing protein [Amycolatopsis decaplanina]|uniref:PRC-barrel domain-containing protein n=1 Tax=Amycolatopsis decaplanina DSM 44594 TaxID=1284240 RepID=M2Z0W6_9PSEU|nr:PRC-barrel domain-containing protein [Amycolatopsis decaplanina]EME60902.1 hypothetical protein H074_12262 [Amycolatopsis decaplanina DSM 44594]